MPRKPAGMHDRSAEWVRLSEVSRSPRPELWFVVGRRRAGKSFLLAPFARAAGGIYYQATRRTEAEQLLALTRLVAEHFDDPALREGPGFSSWEALFRYLVARAAGRPLVVVLDELPYLVEAAPALPSILQALFDHEVARSRLKLVLCGSHISAMRRLEAADQPLYARRTGRLAVSPFSFNDAARFFPRYGPLDRLRAYAAFGGLPGHLALVEPRRSWRENVARQLVDPGGRLFDDAQHMLDAFLGDAAIHYSILEAIAGGDSTWSGITSRVGKTAGSLSRPMTWLLDMEVVERVAPLTERRPDASRRALYRIADPYVAFWHRFVSPLVVSGLVRTAPAERLVRERIEPALDGFMGSVFEACCRDFARSGRGLPFRPAAVGEWWSARSEEQVDLVALSGDGELLVAECKWGQVTEHDLRALRRRAPLVAAEAGPQRRVHLALFSATGKSDAGVRAAVARRELAWFTAADLFASGA